MINVSETSRVRLLPTRCVDHFTYERMLVHYDNKDVATNACLYFSMPAACLVGCGLAQPGCRLVNGVGIGDELLYCYLKMYCVSFYYITAVVVVVVSVLVQCVHLCDE